MPKNVKNKSATKYFNEKRKIRNKTEKIEKTIKLLELAREVNKEHINKNTNLPPKRRSIENIVKSCRIGRKREGFSQESFKHNRPTIIPTIPNKKKK